MTEGNPSNLLFLDFFLIVLWQLKHWIRTGPGFWRTSPQRSTKFTKSTSRVRRRIWRLWRWLPSFVMTGLLLRNEVESWVVSMDKDFATNSSETSDRMYPSRLSRESLAVEPHWYLMTLNERNWIILINRLTRLFFRYLDRVMVTNQKNLCCKV